MKLKHITLEYGTKFNDPKKRYTNHSYHCRMEAELEAGDDAEAVRQALAVEAEGFVNRRRDAIFLAAEMEDEFKSAARDVGYAIDAIDRYEEGTRLRGEKVKEVEKKLLRMKDLQGKLAAAGVTVEMPRRVQEMEAQVVPVLPAAGPALDPDEEGNDPDEDLDEDEG